jgi:hypothetical protein
VNIESYMLPRIIKADITLVYPYFLSIYDLLEFSENAQKVRPGFSRN